MGLTSSPCSVSHLLAHKLYPGSGPHHLENGLLGHIGEDADNVFTFLAQIILERGPKVGHMSDRLPAQVGEALSETDREFQSTGNCRPPAIPSHPISIHSILAHPILSIPSHPILFHPIPFQPIPFHPIPSHPLLGVLILSGPSRAYPVPSVSDLWSPCMLGWYSLVLRVPRLPVGSAPGLCTAMLAPGFGTRTQGPGHRPVMRWSRQLQFGAKATLGSIHRA